MICRFEALALCVLLAASTGSAAVDTPPSKCLYTVCNTIQGGRIVGTTRLACDQDCPGVNRSLPSGGATRWGDVQNEIDTVSLAQQAARRNAEAFARVLGELSADQRLFAEGTLSPGARGSIAAAMDELTRRLNGIAASNGELQRRVARLQSNDARLSAELITLQEQRRALLSAGLCSARRRASPARWPRSRRASRSSKAG
jgi:hypothetical protein